MRHTGRHERGSRPEKEESSRVARGGHVFLRAAGERRVRAQNTAGRQGEKGRSHPGSRTYEQRRTLHPETRVGISRMDDTRRDAGQMPTFGRPWVSSAARIRRRQPSRSRGPVARAASPDPPIGSRRGGTRCHGEPFIARDRSTCRAAEQLSLFAGGRGGVGERTVPRRAGTMHHTCRLAGQWLHQDIGERAVVMMDVINEERTGMGWKWRVETEDDQGGLRPTGGRGRGRHRYRGSLHHRRPRA